MEVQYNEDVIKSIFIKNVNLIFPWGVEFADERSFFSLENTLCNKVDILEKDYKFGNGQMYFRYILKMYSGKIGLSGNDVINESENEIEREIELEALDDINLLDFVMRYRFRKECIKKAMIAGKEIIHQDSNKYYQFPVMSVELTGKLYKINCSIQSFRTQDKFKMYMYVRDNKQEWVVHVRMLPSISSSVCVKLCSKWFSTYSFPYPISKLICSNQKIFEYLKYHNEIRPDRKSTRLNSSHMA